MLVNKVSRVLVVVFLAFGQKLHELHIILEIVKMFLGHHFTMSVVEISLVLGTATKPVLIVC